MTAVTAGRAGAGWKSRFYVWMTLANTTRSGLHKRLMELAKISILVPPLARPFLAFAFASLPPGPPPVWAPLPASAIADLFLMAALVFDPRTRRKPNPVYLIGGAALNAVQPPRLPASETDAWREAARGFAGLAGSLPPARG